MSEAPTIETARLRLRPHRIGDFETMAALFDSAWARFMGGPFTRIESWSMLASEVGSWSLLGHGSWAVDSREDDVFIGQVGINRYSHWPEVELGWSIWPAYEGRGYGQEAAQAARGWAYDKLHLRTLVSYIDPANTRSIALAERLGARHDPGAKRPTGATAADTVVYRHPKPEHA